MVGRQGSIRQNTQYWSINNLREIQQIRTKGYQSVNVWWGVIGTYIFWNRYLLTKS